MAQFATCAVFASLIGMLYEGDGRPRIDQKGVEKSVPAMTLVHGSVSGEEPASPRHRAGVSSLFPQPSARAPFVLPAAGSSRRLARRQAASGAYGLPLSVLAMQLADVVLQQALPCVFVSVTYRLIDPRHGLEQRLGAFLLVAQAVAFAGASLGYLIACLSPDSECRRPASSSFDVVASMAWSTRRSPPLFPRSRDRCGAAVCLSR